MRSSSNVIRSGEITEGFQKWAPADFEQGEPFPEEMIRATTLDFFGINREVKEKKRNLIKNTQTAITFEEWQPGAFANASAQTQKSIPQSWTPFIEVPNPQKIAKGIIDEAKAKSEGIVVTAQEKAIQIEKEAYEKGMEQAKEEMRQTLQAASSVINVAREWRTDMMNQAEPMIMDLVKKIAQKMFGDGIILDNETLQKHFSSVVESARSLDDLRIYMHPLDAQELGPDWREYQASVLGHKVEIVSNDSIKRGGCYIQGEWGTADALVETQLEAILHQFSEVEQPPKEDE